MGKVLIRDLLVEGIIGIHPEEREVPQEIVINLELQTELRHAGETDDIADCVDYEKLVQRVTEHTLKARRRTVEALAADLAQLCLVDPVVTSVRVRIEKPTALASCRSVGVEIERHQTPRL